MLKSEGYGLSLGGKQRSARSAGDLQIRAGRRLAQGSLIVCSTIRRQHLDEARRVVEVRHQVHIVGASIGFQSERDRTVGKRMREGCLQLQRGLADVVDGGVGDSGHNLNRVHLAVLHDHHVEFVFTVCGRRVVQSALDH